MSKTRAPPSGANPSNLVEKRIDTEDDVLHVKVRCQMTDGLLFLHHLDFQMHTLRRKTRSFPIEIAEGLY